MSENPAIIELQGLVKCFGRLKVLDHLSLQIRRHRITAIVGPNASGKTTLIKCILGLIHPQAGLILFDGKPLDGGWAYRERIGYMPQIARFPDYLKAIDVLSLLNDLRQPQRCTSAQLCEAFKLGPELLKPLGTLSGGTRQKVSAVLAFRFDPDVLFLDEPTAGLDPLASSLLKDWVIHKRTQGKTIILTSHLMNEIEELADVLIFLHQGRVQMADTPSNITSCTGETTLERAIAHVMAGSID